MKIHIEINENLTEDELIIRCRSISDKILEIQKTASDIINSSQKLIFYKGSTEYYLAVDDILFFETDNGQINAHTRNGIYQTKYKLYELENLLPGFFMRISKSAILNTSQIYSINRNLTASSIVEFTGTHKRVFVSRYYYKPLISKLEEQKLRC